MLHVILLILKIIGIILLSILGLLLLILLVCLFVPVLYRIGGSKHESSMHGKAKVTWLFLSISVGIDNQDKELKTSIRLFGIPLEFFRKIGHIIGKIFRGITKAFRKTVSLFKKKDRATAKENIPSTGNKEQAVDEDIVETQDVVDEIKEYLNPNTKEDNKRNATSKESVWQRIKTILIKMWHFPRWLYEQIRKIYLTIKEFCGKIKRWKDFLIDDTFKRAIKFGLRSSKKLLKSILPRKITGNITYGFDDPSLTGQILAVASMVTPLYRGEFKVVPMFEKKMLEGDIYMKGYVLGFALLRMAWSVYRNKDAKAVIREFSQKEA